jgi:hypothetical protein
MKALLLTTLIFTGISCVSEEKRNKETENFSIINIKNLCIRFCVIRNFNLTAQLDNQAYLDQIAENMTQAITINNTYEYCLSNYTLDHCFSDINLIPERLEK